MFELLGWTRRSRRDRVPDGRPVVRYLCRCPGGSIRHPPTEPGTPRHTLSTTRQSRPGCVSACVATTAEMDGRQRDFLNEVRTFHTTGTILQPRRNPGGTEATPHRSCSSGSLAVVQGRPCSVPGSPLLRRRDPNHRRSHRPRRRHRRRAGTPATRRLARPTAVTHHLRAPHPRGRDQFRRRGGDSGPCAASTNRSN